MATRDELREKAKSLGVPHASSMNKAELVDAINASLVGSINNGTVPYANDEVKTDVEDITAKSKNRVQRLPW